MALALYRRYRPDTFDGVIGQNQVTVPLGRALDQGKLTHAYLFSGPRGCGKTSCARILARCVNCEKGPTSHPCGECDSCRDLATGGPGSIDVVEIDAASHNGVDDARELRERAGFAPARDRYKIFILDEAHMVTQQGFNAMLKIVEEPPEHVMFIFATTEPEKVIGTIRSRTHHYPFRLVPPEVMGPYLEEVCSKEGIQAQAGVLRLAMRAGGGSMRDTLSVLDQLMVGARDNTITQDSAIALLGFTPETLIGAAIDAIIDCNGEGLYEVVQKVVVGGFDPRRFVEDLLSRVRDLLVLTLGGAHAQSVLSDDAEAENLQELHRQASSLGLQALTQIAQIINETFASMSGATSPRMRLELLAARLLSYRFAQQDHAASSPSDADSGLDRQSVSRKPAQTGGFIGSRRSERQESRQDSAKLYAAGQERAHTQARTQEDAQAQELPHTSSEAGSPSQTGAAVEGTKGVAAPVAHTSVAHAPSTHTLPAQPSNSSINPSNGNPSNSASGSAAPVSVVPASVDERWDALVNALPADVREYVTRAKVPSVALDVANSGRQRLRMTFDTPLSQHAFALAVASEGVEGETSVPKIVLLMVRHSFGEGSFIAPSPTAADGQAVESTRKMSPQQLADVKRRIALSKAGLSAASLGMSTNRNPGANTSEKAGAAKAPAGSSAHGGHADSDHRASAQQDDGVQESDSAHHRGNAVGSGDALEDDPWAQPGPSRSAYAQSAHAQGEASAAPRHGDSHKKKTVAVPDMSDDDDPWASPSASDAQIIQHDSNLDASGESSPGSDSVQAGVQPNQHFLGVHTATNEEHRSPNPAAAAQTSDDVPHAPQVDADDDTYSMQDESLSDGNVLDMEEIKRIFDVKQVETYQADDPLNPVNIEHHKQQGHE